MDALDINRWSQRQLQILMDAKDYKNSLTNSDWIVIYLKRPFSDGKIDFIDPDLMKLKNVGLIEIEPEFSVELTYDFMMEGEWEYRFERKRNESIPDAWQRFRKHYHQKTGVFPPQETLDYPMVWVAKYFARFVG